MTDFKEKIRIKEQVKSRSNFIHKVYLLDFILKVFTNYLRVEALVRRSKDFFDLLGGRKLKIFDLQ